MINVQQVQQRTTQLNNENQKVVTVNVYNQVGQKVDSYEISGNTDSQLGNSLKHQEGVFQVLVNGVKTSMNNLKDMTFGQVSNSVTIMEEAGIGINATYNINGNNYALPANQNNEVTQTGARIYVPSSVLKNNTLSSVEIGGVDYSGQIEGNYVVVKNEIPVVSQQQLNVSVRFHNNHTVPGKGVAPSQQGKADVDVVIMNQYGQELTSQNVNNTNGFGLLHFFSNLPGECQSIQYNGNNVTLVDLLSQQYVEGTSNMLVVTVQTEATTNVSANLFGRNIMINNSFARSITTNRSEFTLPEGLARNFNVGGVTINGILYKGVQEGNKYVVNEFVPNQSSYNAVLNLVRK